MFIDLSLWLSFFLVVGKEVSWRQEFLQEDIGLRKGGRQLYSPTVL
jgi:hypothetical protein